MAREAWTSLPLVAACVGAAVGVPGASWLALFLALAFVYCQARLLQASKGIPAWRDAAIVPFLVATGLAEGAGVFLAAAPWHGGASMPLVAGFGALLIARLAAWLAYRRRIAATTAPGATVALDRAGRALQLPGTLVPLALALAAGFVAGDAVLAIVGVAGLLAALAGAYAKLQLVTRAGFNQGFALRHVPVRGVRP
jgi:phenylacetyl-CoA:acceptor oxidoreductase subunit 2